MAELAPVRALVRTAPPAWQAEVVLGYDARLLRRKRLAAACGAGFVVDLPAVTSLDDYWGFELEDGSFVRIVAALEPLVAVSGPEPLRYAWHIGNRHTPCQIAPGRLLIRADHVLEAMLRGLGATLTPVMEPFRPEGGAYGHGRTMSHDHGHSHAHGRGLHHHHEDHAG